MDANKIKSMVKDQYGAIARSSGTKKGSCCSSGCCGTDTTESSVFSEDYSKLEGYVPDADLGLGCGIPLESAKIKQGDVVVDLGSGAGNDCFVVRRLVGEKGRVIGVDMTEEMIAKAQKNNATMGYSNVEFRLGEIENLPVEDDTADLVISNCVLNLVPDKHKAFQEILRVLKKGGHFSISDVVLEGKLPEKVKSITELYAGCISGALSKDEYLRIIQETGFEGIAVDKEKVIGLPEEVLTEVMNKEEIREFENCGVKILSITVRGVKPRG